MRTLIVASLLVFVIAVSVTLTVGSFDWSWWGALEGTQLTRAQILSNILGPLSGVAAVIALGINLVTTSETLSQTTRTEQSTRFQKAVELIGEAKSTTTIVAGVELLSGLARENPGVYLYPVAGTVASALSDIDSEFKEECSLFSINSSEAYEKTFPRAAIASYAMFDWFGTLRPLRKDAWPTALNPGLAVNRQPLYRPYLEDSMYLRKNFARTDIERAVIKDVTFELCNLAHASWRCYAVEGELLFKNCDLRGARLKIWDKHNVRLWQPTQLVKVEGGKTANFEINGLPYEDWLAGAKLDDDVVADWVTNPPIDDGGIAGRLWKRVFG